MRVGNVSTGREKELAFFCAIFLGLVSHCYGQIDYTDSCISINKQLGKCVPLEACPLFLSWIQTRPIVKSNIKLVVRFTCYFDLEQPKVCCPTEEIDEGQNLISDKSSFTFSFPTRLARLPQPQKIESATRKTYLPDLLFPSDSYFTSRGKAIDSKIIFNDDKPRSNRKFRLLPTIENCSNGIKLDRLVGTYGTHPWIAAIGSKNDIFGNFDNYCSGSVINQRYILTSASCLFQFQKRISHIRLGDYNLDTDIDQGSDSLPKSRYQEYKAENKIPHPNYFYNGTDDIALIRVDRDIDFTSPFVKPVCLPLLKEYELGSSLQVEDLKELVGKKLFVGGWSANFDRERILREGPVQVSPMESCEDVYGKLSKQTQICVGGQNQDNSCIVDLGGPVLTPARVNPTHRSGFRGPKIFQLGLLSSKGPTVNECRKNILPPSVYTSVYPYLDWILSKLEP